MKSVREYTRDTIDGLVRELREASYQPARRWIEQELVKIPCRCPVCERRTDLSRVPDVRKALAETRITSDAAARHRQARLEEIKTFFLTKLATREGAYLVFCDRCTLADLHRKSNPHRIDYYKKGIQHGRYHRHSRMPALRLTRDDSN